MHSSFAIRLIALTAPFLVSAAPAYRRAASSDITVFTFADVLEQLEFNFYKEALGKFKASDFQAAGFSSAQIPSEQFTAIQSDEGTHSSVLEDALKSFGAKPVTNCQFKFDAVLKDVTTMAATARVVENVGVAAYLGAAHLIQDPRLLTAAGSILTVEARHQTILNLFSSSGTSIPSAFDLAFTPSEVLAIAGPFISGCNLGLPANTPLTITNTGAVGPGTLLKFQASSINGTIPQNKLFCQMLVGGDQPSISLPLAQCVVPKNINGPVAIYVTNDGQPLSASVIDRATVNVVAGPTLAFIDTQPQFLNKLIASGQAPPDASTGSAASSTVSAASSTVSAASSTGSPGDSSTMYPPSATAAPAAGTSSALAAIMSITPDGPSPDGHTIVLGWSTSNSTS